MSQPQDVMMEDRKQLLDSIRGQRVLIPNLRPLFSSWGNQINPNYQKLIPVVNQKLESLVQNEKRLKKLKTADFALFASSWWPTAQFNELQIVTFLAIWLFLWDDELDEPTGVHSDNFQAAQAYRKETLEFIRRSLGIGLETTSPIANPIFKSFSNAAGQLLTVYNRSKKLLVMGSLEHSLISTTILGGLRVIEGYVRFAVDTGKRICGLDHDTLPTASDPITDSFRVIGNQLRVSYTIEQRQMVFEELKYYIHTTQTEQEIKLSGRIPSVKEYWKARMGTSAVGVCEAVVEYAHKIRASRDVTHDPLMKALCDETNIIVVIANDMLSLKKEIALGCIDSLVPLYCAQLGSIQAAIDAAYTDLLASVDRFESAAEELLSLGSTSTMSKAELQIFVRGCRECWSLHREIWFRIREPGKRKLLPPAMNIYESRSTRERTRMENETRG
ncbi:hypothetical protein B7494_g3094 [Chlorociboria aeruginascens]|nr:hypothetical protein B7494_g3094 [Chlorociboria aeruginascens]